MNFSNFCSASKQKRRRSLGTDSVRLGKIQKKKFQSNIDHMEDEEMEEEDREEEEKEEEEETEAERGKKEEKGGKENEKLERRSAKEKIPENFVPRKNVENMDKGKGKNGEKIGEKKTLKMNRRGASHIG